MDPDLEIRRLKHENAHLKRQRDIALSGMNMAGLCCAILLVSLLVSLYLK